MARGTLVVEQCLHQTTVSPSSALAYAADDMAEPGAGCWREVFWVDAGQEDARLFWYRVEEGGGFSRAAAIENPGDPDLTHPPRQRDIGKPALFVEIAVG